MKKVLLLVIMMIALAIPLLAVSETTQIVNQLLLILSPVIVGVVGALAQKLFKLMGISVDNTMLEGILAKILELIVKQEQMHGTASGADKLKAVTNQAYATLSKKEQKLLEKRYGSVETAVQVAFEGSSVALKNRK
ncbi:MAG TPA: hypothetical protein PL124_11145 [Candidatus Cloacimonadota bacterium]|nr:hypothetical protein [Candidatus Cloacimonadota bacterium]HPS39961.1 hypothetical protein [Candidatus Cloacimonadota bacterium]